jgi:hypothetical protein
MMRIITLAIIVFIVVLAGSSWVKSGEDGMERNQEREWFFKG